MSNYPILLTGTINPLLFKSVNVLIKDPSIRLAQYKDAINKYIKNSIFNKIIFLENSGYNVNWSEQYDLADKFGKEIEFLVMKADIENINIKGKSFGESELITYGINNSRLIKLSRFIYKATGRIFLKNSSNICKTSEIHENEFIVYNKSKWCVTHFFKVIISDYSKYLSKLAYECNDSIGKDIESVFFDNLKFLEHKIQMFNVFPDLTGIIGSSGKRYDSERYKMVAKNLLNKLNFFSYNEKGYGF